MRYRDQDELPFEGIAERPPRMSVSRHQISYPARSSTAPKLSSRARLAMKFQLPPNPIEHTSGTSIFSNDFSAAPQPVDPLKKEWPAFILCLRSFFLRLHSLAEAFKLQVLDHGAFSQEAAEQYKTEVPIDARGAALSAIAMALSLPLMRMS